MMLVSSTGPAVREDWPGVGARLGTLAHRLGEQLTAGSANDETTLHLFASLGRVSVGVADAMVDRHLEPRHAAAICRVIGALQDEVATRAHLRRSRAFERIQEALIAIGRGASRAQLVERAPAALCDACTFDRAAISLRRDATWTPVALHVASDADSGSVTDAGGLPAAVARPFPPGRWETELVRRRRSVLVESSQPGPTSVSPFVERAGASAYVAAPMVVDGRVIGLLHADAITSGRALGGLDRDLIKVFADGLGLAYERAALAERMEQQRARLAAAFSSVDPVIGELQSTAVRLTRTHTGATVELMRPSSVAVTAHNDDRLLTRREHEILALMATGSTNVQIATRLFVSESTVKSHVKRILRKLPAANRAEAVYRYKCMTVVPDERRSRCN